ncbi:MAG: glutaredoxin family protein [Pseudomonadota bacterium]
MTILPKELYLYSTSHCHLCELAEALLIESTEKLVEVIEIANDDRLLSQYGLRIPVLKRLDTNAELGWPFNSNDIALFLRD